MKATSLGSSRFFFVSCTVLSLLKFIRGSSVEEDRPNAKGCAYAKDATVGCLHSSPSQKSAQLGVQSEDF
jgi:hypothetical protein